jgi:hypothetical protein
MAPLLSNVVRFSTNKIEEHLINERKGKKIEKVITSFF